MASNRRGGKPGFAELECKQASKQLAVMLLLVVDLVCPYERKSIQRFWDFNYRDSEGSFNSAKSTGPGFLFRLLISRLVDLKRRRLNKSLIELRFSRFTSSVPSERITRALLNSSKPLASTVRFFQIHAIHEISLAQIQLGSLWFLSMRFIFSMK